MVSLWETALAALDDGRLEPLAGWLDWVAKLALIESMADDLSDPRASDIDRRYAEVWPDRGADLDVLVPPDEVAAAVHTAPPTTRARLRGAFIKACIAARRDFTVDWIHLKLNDTAQRTVLCKDPFASTDERVDRLLAEIRRTTG